MVGVQGLRLYASPTGEVSRFHGRFHPNYCLGDRSQHGHLQRDEHRASAFSSGPESATVRLLSFEKSPLSTSQTGYGDMSMSMPVFEALRTRQEVFTEVIRLCPAGF